jgi:hypothetical protein
MSRSTQAQLVALAPTLTPASYTTGKVLFTGVELASMVFQSGRVAELRSIAGFDKADAGIALDLYFASVSTAIGVVGSDASITDADLAAEDFQGRVSIATGDYTDLGGAREFTHSVLPGLLLQPIAASRSIYVSCVARGSIMIAGAADLGFNFGFKWW